MHIKPIASIPEIDLFYISHHFLSRSVSKKYYKMDAQRAQTPPLIAAVTKGDETTVKLLLTSDTSSINSRDSDGRTPLFHAVRVKKHDGIFHLLLAKPTIDVAAKENKGWSALTDAATLGLESLAKTLLATGKIDVNAKANDSRTPLSYAAGEGHEAVVKLLFSVPGIDINAADPENWTPLTYAVGHGHAEVVRLLLAVEGIDPDPKDDGWTPLCTACEQGYVDIVRQLLATRAVDVNVMTKDGTPLDIASHYGWDEIVKMLSYESETPGHQDASPG